MRLIRTLVAQAESDDVVAILDEHNIDYVLFREDSGRDDAVLVEFPIPTQAVESILDELRDATRGDESYTVVASAESVFSDHSDEMEERFITGTEEDDSIATEEVRSKALDMTPSPQTYYSMTFLSALVATAGLLLDSPAVVVGSMVIAPIVGSALTASVGTVLDDRAMILNGFKTQLFGLLLAIIGATVFSFALKSAAFLPPALDITTTQQISQRISPGLLSVVVGICAGAAGAFGLATDFSETLVGVMIAAALIPAAAAVGIGVAWGIPTVALGAFLLLVLNAIAIHVSGAFVLWYLGYRPGRWTTSDIRSRVSVRKVSPLLLTIGALGIVFIGVGTVVSAHIVFEQQVNQATGDVLSDDRYEDLDLIAVRSEFSGTPPVTLSRDQQITVVVGRAADREYPELSRAIARNVASETGRDVTVVIEFVEQQTYRPDQ